MNDNNQTRIQELIERLLAGEPVDTTGFDDEELESLFALAEELHDERPQPEAGFEAMLRDRLKALRAEEEPAPVEELRERWVPGWVTWRRAAAVAATLVVGLGIAGVTQAIISGEGPLNGNGDVAMTADDNRGTIEEKAFDQADPSGATAGEFAVPGSEPGEAAGAAGTEAMVENSVPTDLQRVIHTADYEIELPIGDFQDRFDEVATIAARYGGYVTYSDSSVSGEKDDQLKEGMITIRIANVGDNFNAAQDEIEDLGLVVSKQVSGEDVSEEFVDLESRLRNAEAQQASLLALMDKAETIEEILLVQSQLDSVQMEIEQLKGSLDYMKSMTDYATISVHLYEEDVEQDEDTDDDDGIVWGFTDAIKYAGWLAVQTVNFVIIALGVIIPSLVILSLVLLVVYRLVQRRRKGD